MSGFGLPIPTHFWASGARSGTCAFPALRRSARSALWTAMVVAAGLEFVALRASGAARLALIAAALAAPLAALLWLRRLRRSHLLEAAFADMWQGLALYDAEGRLLLHNGQFCAMLGLSPADIERARTHRDIIELSVAAGNYQGLTAPEVWREEAAFIARRQAALAYIDLPGKRTIAESHQPMAGGGWVRTYADVTGRRQIEARILHMARHDALTDLPNRAFFHERLEEALKGVCARAPLALMFLDLDRFKAVNDARGHAVGDRLLAEVAERLRREIGEGCTAARLGGDEFAILQTGVADAAEAGDLADRLVASISEPYDIDGSLVFIGASIGVAFAPADGAGADELLKNADLALYRVKSAGRGGYRFFAFEAEAPTERRIRRQDLAEAGP